MTAPRRLLTFGHSYTVDVNRRLAHEMQKEGAGRWEVTIAAPDHVDSDLRSDALLVAEDEPCPVRPVKAYGSRWPHLMVYGGGLRRLLREPWDLVHCWQEPYVFSGAQAAFWTPPRIPLVYSTLQNISKRYPPPFSWVERHCLRRCAGWIGYGESVVETMLERGYGVKPHRAIPLGVDLDTFRPDSEARLRIRRSLGWEEAGAPVVGFVGRFVPEKGLALLMKTLDSVAVPWRALIVGEGPLEADLRRWAQGRGKDVRVATGVRHDEVPGYINAMDLLCAPSQTTPRWREQFGRMTIEAFACGVPVIASDSGEIPRVVGDAGLVVGEKDEAGWKSALSELLQNPSQRADLAARGRERARENYAWPLVARKHLEFFDRLLDPGRLPLRGRRRRILSISRSYVVGLNRGLPREMARLGGDRWEVTAAAPEHFNDGSTRLSAARDAGETGRVEFVRAHLSRPGPLLFYGRRLKELLREPWDIIHCWEEPYSLAGAQVALWAPRSASLIYRSAQNIMKRPLPPFSSFEDYCLDRCSGWTASGKTVVETLLRKGYGRKPHRLIPLGVDPEVFRPDHAARAKALSGLSWDPRGPPIIGFVGRLVPEKGLRLLTGVLDGLDTPWRALLVGEGPLEKELRTWARRQGGRARVLTGVRHDAVWASMNAMDLLCVPSQSTPAWREQFGRVIVEAMACGVPVVASDSGEIPHVVLDAGLIVGESDAAGWSRTLSELLGDAGRRRELSRRGLDLSRREYSWSAAARKHLDFFEEVLAA